MKDIEEFLDTLDLLTDDQKSHLISLIDDYGYDQREDARWEEYQNSFCDREHAD
jgi:hypothetical protein